MAIHVASDNVAATSMLYIETGVSWSLAETIDIGKVATHDQHCSQLRR